MPTPPAAATSAARSSRADELAGALHEVSNALTVVLGWLDAALLDAPPGQLHSAVEVARRHARDAHRLARVAIGASHPASEDARSLQAVAEESLLAVSREADRRGVHATLGQCEAADVFVKDASAARQILLNLLLNALDFSPRGATVQLAVEHDVGVARVRVSDEGPGIPAGRVETLFSSTKSTRRGGCGLGLRHCRGLALAHGGALELEATSAQGTTFLLEWPLADVPSGFVYQDAPPPLLDSLSVVLLEDDAAVSTLVELGLGSRGTDVTTVTTSAALFEQLECERPDAVLLDLSPLGGEAGAALEQLSQRYPGLPLIIVSGSAAPLPVDVQVAAWVQKPFEVGDLAHALASVSQAKGR